jgi:catechol 2,3-dioxygenase-like lactoylglutathione lyase family enzyme
MVDGLDALQAITFFIEDLASTRRFYEQVFGLKVLFEDQHSAAFRLGGVIINLLQAERAPELVTPLPVGGAGGGRRFLFTIEVENVDDVCAELGRHGVTLLNGPIDRPWGRRTAVFCDPAGVAWEVAQDLPRS